MMDFDEYQERAKDTDLYPPEKWSGLFFNLIEYRTLCLCGEVGEMCEKILEFLTTTLELSTKSGKLANVIKKVRRDGVGIPVDSITHELGDILWYMARLSDLLDVRLGTIAEENLTMLARRMEEGKIKGSGDRTLKMYCRKCGSKTSQGIGGHQRNCPKCGVVLEGKCLHTYKNYEVFPEEYLDVDTKSGENR